MNIGVDFDGVIADSTGLKQELFKARYNINIPKGYCSKEKIEKTRITISGYSRLVNELYKSEKFLDADEVENAKDSIEKIIELGHKIYIVTSREDSQIVIAKKWLDMKNINYHSIVHTNNHSKQEYCLNSNIKILLDDSYEKLHEIDNRGIELYLFEKPYNKNTKILDSRIKKVRDWYTFLSTIRNKTK